MNVALKIRLARWARVLLAVLGTVSAGHAPAWEADVHFGLTKWLALQAGFTEIEAQMIADGDQGVDKSLFTGPEIATVLSSCLRTDRPGSDTVHQHHFPSEASTPADPVDRVVTPGTVWVGGNKVPIPRMRRENLAGSLADIGSYLHALQDTWAHQGEPDVPEPCVHREYGWGHAIKRGGWTCHLADLSYKWQEEDVPRMAEATYKVLRETSGKNPNRKWASLVKEVKEFAKAKSKQEKSDWFNSHKIVKTQFLADVSLPDCKSGASASCRFSDYGDWTNRWYKLTTQRLEKLVPPEVIAFLDSTLASISTGSVPTVRERIDMSLAQAALARSLHVEEDCPSLMDVNIEFAIGAPFLEGTGGQQPLEVCELAMKLEAGGKIDCATATAQAKAALLGTGRRGPGMRFFTERYQGKFPFFIYSASEDKQRGEYRALAQFVHLPSDVLTLTVRRIAGRLMITDLHWM